MDKDFASVSQCFSDEGACVFEVLVNALLRGVQQGHAFISEILIMRVSLT